MTSVLNENNYDINLIKKVKKSTGSLKKVQKIIEHLKKLEVEDLKDFPELKVETFEEENETKKTVSFKIAAPILGFRHYLEDLKKPNLNINNNYESNVRNTPSTGNVNEEEEVQVDSSDLSGDD